MAIRYLADLETAKIDMGGNELHNAVIHPLDTLSRPASPNEGQVFFNTTSKLLELWDGTAWLEIPNTLSGQVNFPSYGTGAYQGIGNFFLTVDASGNLIENTSISPLSNGAIINGALNIIDVSSGESILYGHSGIIAQQNLDSSFSFADGSLTINPVTLDLRFLNQEVHFGFVNTNYLPVKANVGYTTSPVHVDPNNSYVSINNTNPTAPFDVLGSVRLRSYGTGNLTSVVGESTFPAFDIAGNIVESQLITTDGSNIALTNLTTGVDAGVVAYDSTNKLIKSSFLQKDGTRLKIQGYGQGTNTGFESRFLAVDNAGRLLETNRIAIQASTVLQLKGLGTDTGGLWINQDATYPILTGMTLGSSNRYWGNIYISNDAGIVQRQVTNGEFKISLGNLRDDGLAYRDAMIIKSPIDYVNTRYLSVYNASNNRLFSIAAGGVVEAPTYGLGNITGTSSTFPAFDANGKLIESQLITTDGSNIIVNGNLNITEGNAYLYDGVQALRLSKGTDTYYANTVAGQQAGDTSARRQTAFGSFAGFQTLTPDQAAFGFWAGRQSTGNSQSVFGSAAGYLSTGANQSAFGLWAGRQNAGANQSAFAFYAGYLNIGANQSVFGFRAGFSNSGNNQSAFGSDAGFSNTGDNQSAFGFQAGYENEGDNTILIGYQAGRGNTTDNIFILKQNNVNTTSLIEGNFLSGQVAFRNYGTGTITGTESTFTAFDINGNVLDSNILKIGAAPDGGPAIGINTVPDWPLHIKGGVFNMALIESTSTASRLLFKTSTSTIFPLIEVIGDNMLLDAPKVTVKNTHLDSPTSGGDSRILGIDINNKIILSDGIRVIPNLSGLPTLDLRNVDTYVTNTLAGFDGTKIVNNPHIQIAQGGGFTNVGIGGTPQFPLHVFGDTRNNAMFVEGQNNETRLAVRDLSGGNIYMASRFGVMKLFSNSNIQLWAGSTNRATVNANGTLTLSTYGLGNNIGSEATFPVFDSTGVIRESRLITTDGSALTFVNGTRKTRILDGEIGFERLNGGGYPAYVRVNRDNGNFLEINARSRVDITTNTFNIQAIFAESHNGSGHQFPYYGQGNLQSGTDAYIAAFTSTGIIKESSVIKLLGNATALAIGHNVPYNSQAYYTILGHSALLNSTNATNFITAIGAFTGGAVTGLFRNSTILGNAAIFQTANNVNNSVVIGEQAGQRSGYSGSVVIGYRAGYFVSGDRQFNNVIAIGDQVVPEKDNQTIIGKTSSTEFKTYGQIVNPTYGLGNVTGTESTFATFQSDGKLIESQLITTNGSDVTIGQTPTSFIKTNDSGGTVFGYGSSQLINGGALVWKDGATERFRITAGGNVGIGTSSPIAKLDVRGAISILNGNELSWHNGFGTLTGGIYSDGGGALDFFTRDGSNRDRKLRIRGNGQLLLDKYGIGSFTSSFTRILAVKADGDVVEITADDVMNTLPSYADNAAAVAAGLTAGNTYYNSTDNTYKRVI